MGVLSQEYIGGIRVHWNRSWLIESEIFAMEFRHKTAVITGAANGVGRAVAIRLCSAGARVVLWDMDETGLAETARLCARPEAVECESTGCASSDSSA
jgi:short-subunit dehydrogenase